MPGMPTVPSPQGAAALPNAEAPRRIGLVEARIRAKKNNLVEKQTHRPSADMGAGSIGALFDPAASPFEDSSPGTKTIPSL